MAESTQKSRHEQIKVGMSAGMYGAQAFAEVQDRKQQQSKSITTGQASVLQAEQGLHIQSGGDTRLEGVQASGKRVTAQIAGELSLRSTQDTTQEKAESTGGYVRAGVPMGPVGSGSLDVSHQTQKMSAESESIKERTMLTAGQDGFDIQVGKATHLIGGGIQSEAPPDQNQLMTEAIQAEQIDNQANYEQSKTGIHLHSGANPAEMLVRHATSHVSCLTNRPRVKSGVTAGFFSGVQPKLSSKEAATPPSPEPVHQPIAAFDTVEMAEQSILGETVSQLGMQTSGDVIGVVEQKMPAGLATEVLRSGLHASVAGMSATLSDHSVSGAMAGAAAGNLVTHAWGRTKARGEWDKAVSDLTQNAVSGIAGAAAGILFDGQGGAYSGAAQAILADQWNRQLHEEECEELDAFIQVSASEEQQRLKEAAVYLTQGSASVPHNDPQRAVLEVMEAKGKTHAAELELLSETGLFKYTEQDDIKDWITQDSEKFERSLGALQATFGMMGVKASKVLISTGSPLWKLVGAGLGAISAPAMADGVKRSLGPYESKEGERVLAALDLASYPGERNRPLEFATEAGLVIGSWGAAKLISKGIPVLRGMSFFKTGETLAVRRARTLAQSKVQGAEGEMRLMAQLRAMGKNVCKPKKGIKTYLGCRYLDIVEYDAAGKIIQAWEAKTGGAVYKAPQKPKDVWITKEYGVPITVVHNP